jgi:hypothetical protein
MNGLASLLRYQMGGPVGYVDGGQIDSIYNTLFGRSADADGRKFYEEKLKNASVADAIAIIGGGATGEDVNDNEYLRQKIAGEVIKAAYSDTLSRSVDEIDPEGLTYYLGQVLYEGLDPTRIDDIFAHSPEAEKFEAKLPGITDILKKNAAGGSYSVYTPPPVVTPPAVTGDTGAGAGTGVVTGDTGAGAGAGAGAGVVTGDTKAIAAPPVSEYGYINDLYKTYFGRDASPGELASYAGIFGPTIEPNEIKDFILGGVTSEEITQDEADILLGLKPDPAKIAAETEAANAEGRPGAGQILGIPTFARQTPSDLTFAPLRRGLGQLRPAMSMTGLTSGQAAFGGVAPTPGQSPPDLITAQDRAKELIDRTYRTVLNRNPTQVGYDFYLPKILSGEFNANNIIPALVGGATSGPDKEIAANYAIQNPSAAQPFTLQTGAYGAPTPTFLARPEKAAEPFPTDPKPLTDPAPVATDREGGLIKMAEGGEPPTPPPMSKLDTLDLGSTFDIADYIDDQGRLVGGYSKPIYDENRVITGYDYRPYERDVVFGELRDKEAAMQLTDAEREQMMVEMAMRQGRTGISPTTGGLAGISTDNLMPSYMRRQPQYYSPAEQFRPRYAEGGNVSSTAQDLASRGRGGDTMLVHMAPHEVTGLNALARMQGTELTINPETGMPEALKLGKLFKTLAPFIPFIPGVGQFLAPAFGALGMGGFSPLLQKAITSGIVGGFTGPKGGFDLQRGLMQGITAYGLGSLQQNLGGPSTPGGPPTSTGPAVSPELGAVDASVTSQNPLLAPGVGDNASLSALERAELGIRPPIDYTPGDITAASKAAEATRAGFPLSDVERGGVSDLGAPFEYQPVSPKNAATTASGMKTPTALLTTGLGLSSTADYDKLTSAGIAVKREKEEEDELYRRLFERSLGAVPVRSGGLMKLA